MTDFVKPTIQIGLRLIAVTVVAALCTLLAGKLDGGDGMDVIALNLNHKDPVMQQLFHDPRFRIALSHAVDRREINEISFHGLAKPRQASPPMVDPRIPISCN